MYKSQAKNLETEMNQMISQLKELQDNLEKEGLARQESEKLVKVYESKLFDLENEKKDYQSQVEDLQEKYENQIVAHQKSENLAETLRYQTKELENEMDQCQSQVKKLKEKYKKECAAHKQTEILIKTYESEIKKLELVQEQYEAKVIDHEIQVREYQSEVASLNEKYKRENILHQMTKKRKEIYKKEAANFVLTKSQLKGQLISKRLFGVIVSTKIATKTL